MEPANTSASKIYLLAVIFLVLTLGLLTLATRFKPQPKTTELPTPTAEAAVVTSDAYLSLVSPKMLTRFSNGEEVTLNLNANSNGVEIVGFDALIGYDKTAFDLISVKSLIPDFKLYQFSKEDYLAITSTKSVSSQVKSPLNGGVVELVFKAKKVGNFNFFVKSTSGKEKTKFVDSQTQVIYPKLNDFALAIY